MSILRLAGESPNSPVGEPMPDPCRFESRIFVNTEMTSLLKPLRSHRWLLILAITLLSITGTVNGQMPFTRGDCNVDGGIDIGDAILGLGILFSGSGPALCADACDVNDDGGNDIGDPIYLLSNLFSGGPTPPEPNDCGMDPTADGLDCAETSMACEPIGCPVDCSIYNTSCITYTCDPLTGECVGENAPAGTPCNDGDACTEGDACDGVGSCGGAPVNCDDGNLCTNDACDISQGCVNTPIPGCGPSYATDIYTQIIESECTFCHAPPSNFGGLNLANTATNDSYATIVNQPSSECGAYDFVEPFNSQASWLFRKIAGTNVDAATSAGCDPADAGSQMPLSPFCCLTQEQIDLIQEWIDSGANP